MPKALESECRPQAATSPLIRTGGQYARTGHLTPNSAKAKCTDPAAAPPLPPLLCSSRSASSLAASAFLSPVQLLPPSQPRPPLLRSTSLPEPPYAPDKRLPISSWVHDTKQAHTPAHDDELAAVFASDRVLATEEDGAVALLRAATMSLPEEVRLAHLTALADLLRPSRCAQLEKPIEVYRLDRLASIAGQDVATMARLLHAAPALAAFNDRPLYVRLGVLQFAAMQPRHCARLQHVIDFLGMRYEQVATALLCEKTPESLSHNFSYLFALYDAGSGHRFSDVESALRLATMLLRSSIVRAGGAENSRAIHVMGGASSQRLSRLLNGLRDFSRMLWPNGYAAKCERWVSTFTLERSVFALEDELPLMQAIVSARYDCAWARKVLRRYPSYLSALCEIDAQFGEAVPTLWRQLEQEGVDVSYLSCSNREEAFRACSVVAELHALGLLQRPLPWMELRAPRLKQLQPLLRQICHYPEFQRHCIVEALRFERALPLQVALDVLARRTAQSSRALAHRPVSAHEEALHFADLALSSCTLNAGQHRVAYRWAIEPALQQLTLTYSY